MTVFTAEQLGNTHRMHIVSAAGDFAYRVSIDEHALTVIETDGHRVEAVKNFESVIIYPKLIENQVLDTGLGQDLFEEDKLVSILR